MDFRFNTCSTRRKWLQALKVGTCISPGTPTEFRIFLGGKNGNQKKWQTVSPVQSNYTCLCSCTEFMHRAILSLLFSVIFVCIHTWRRKKTSIYTDQIITGTSSKHGGRPTNCQARHVKTMERPGINNSPHIGLYGCPRNDGSSWVTAHTCWIHHSVDRTMSMSLVKRAPILRRTAKWYPVFWDRITKTEVKYPWEYVNQNYGIKPLKLLTTQFGTIPNKYVFKWCQLAFSSKLVDIPPFCKLLEVHFPTKKPAKFFVRLGSAATSFIRGELGKICVS